MEKRKEQIEKKPRPRVRIRFDDVMEFSWVGGGSVRGVLRTRFGMAAGLVVVAGSLCCVRAYCGLGSRRARMFFR